MGKCCADDAERSAGLSGLHVDTAMKLLVTGGAGYIGSVVTRTADHRWP